MFEFIFEKKNVFSMSSTADQLDSGGGITDLLLMRINRKGDLGDFAIQEYHVEKLFISLKFSI